MEKLISFASKSWNSAISSTNKFLSRTLSHELANKIDNKKYEVLYEAALDVFNLSDETNVVIYSKENGFHPVIGIEICESPEVEETKSIAKDYMVKYSFNEFFIIDINRRICHYISNIHSPNHFSNLSASIKPFLDDFITGFYSPSIKSVK